MYFSFFVINLRKTLVRSIRQIWSIIFSDRLLQFYETLWHFIFNKAFSAYAFKFHFYVSSTLTNTGIFIFLTRTENIKKRREKWKRKIVEETEREREIVLLVPAISFLKNTLPWGHKSFSIFERHSRWLRNLHVGMFLYLHWTFMTMEMFRLPWRFDASQ